MVIAEVFVTLMGLVSPAIPVGAAERSIQASCTFCGITPGPVTGISTLPITTLGNSKMKLWKAVAAPASTGLVQVMSTLSGTSENAFVKKKLLVWSVLVPYTGKSTCKLISGAAV